NPAPLTHYKIAGTKDEPTIQVSKYRLLPSQPSKAGKGTGKRKNRLRTVTFHVEGSLHPNPNESPSSPLVQSEPEMAEPPSSPSTLFDEDILAFTLVPSTKTPTHPTPIPAAPKR
ncbi:hypothetical protein FS749_001114, partial [Ceratobasidium sp. UAMH 11750]